MPRWSKKHSLLNKVKASIIIPTLNGGNLLLKVCEALIRQEFQASWEVIIIDSQSSDNSIKQTIELFNHSNIPLKLITINKKDFQHGRSRNQAIKESRGEIILLLTQDAIPANKNWLKIMIQSFDNTQVAGVFGRHIAHDNHPRLIQRDLDNHFNRMNEYPIRKIKDQIEYDDEISLRQTFHFFSNNNSALRKKNWTEIPFPEIDFGEDQTWAKKAIESGNSIAYQHDSIVFHSHDFSFIQSCVRTRIEKNFFLKNFGYDLKIDRRKLLPIIFNNIKNDLLWLLKTNQFHLRELYYSFKKNISSNSF